MSISINHNDNNDDDDTPDTQNYLIIEQSYQNYNDTNTTMNDRYQNYMYYLLMLVKYGCCSKTKSIRQNKKYLMDLRVQTVLINEQSIPILQ
jgi:hypothetical protein